MDPGDAIEVVLEAARKGDRRAFDYLVQPHASRLSAAVTRALGSALRARVDPADVLQETFLRAFRDIRRFNGRSEPELIGWLQAIATNVVREAGRRLHARKADMRREVPLKGSRAEGSRAGAGRSLAADTPTPSQVLRRTERLERLKGALRRLSPEHRMVIVLVRLKGLSYKQAAEELGRSPKAISMLLSRALESLRAAFGHTEGCSLPGEGLQDLLDESAGGGGEP